MKKKAGMPDWAYDELGLEECGTCPDGALGSYSRLKSHSEYAVGDGNNAFYCLLIGTSPGKAAGIESQIADLSNSMELVSSGISIMKWDCADHDVSWIVVCHPRPSGGDDDPEKVSGDVGRLHELLLSRLRKAV